MAFGMKSADFDINDIDLENMGSWPLLVKVIFAIIVAAIVSILSYYLLIDSKIDQLNAAMQKE
ncbi:hypothetical protein ABS241_20605, partial [Acinetobacter baumannii]